MKLSVAEVVKLLGAKRSGKCWMAVCPAHDDHNPSLSLSSGKDGQLLVHCFAGCSHAEIIDGLKYKIRWTQK